MDQQSNHNEAIKWNEDVGEQELSRQQEGPE